MVARLRVRQLQEDVNATEEAELRRLEHGATASDDDSTPDLAETATCSGTDGRTVDGSTQDDGGGVVVVGAKKRAEQLDSKLFVHGGYRNSNRITRLQPRGSAGLKTKVPKRKSFGGEGDAGDAAHSAAMKEFSLSEFGSSHVQSRTLEARMGHVGLFGHWLEQNSYGKYMQWNVSDGAHAHVMLYRAHVCVGAGNMRSRRLAGEQGMERCIVAVERDGTPRVPPEAAMMEYVLVMATGDAESRPKGGWKEYFMGEHVKPGLNGRKKGELLGEQKEFGFGPYADAPFRFRCIQEQVRVRRGAVGFVLGAG